MKRKLMLFVTCLFIGIGLVNAQVRVTGNVISSEDGLPVVGASILVKGTTIGTVTDLDGNFTLANVPESAKTVQVSFVGMKTLQAAIKSTMKIILHPDNELLEEVVVVGYGSAKKIGSVVGAVTAVGKEKIANVPTANFADALSGQVSGLSVMSGSGDPTAVADIRIRGLNSLRAGTTPLFILDGAPVSASVFTTLNAHDIENITVLKDAASTSIYGSRAANGVIVITTKKGKYSQNSQVKIRAQYGFSTVVADGTHMMNSQEYIRFRDMIQSPVSQDIKDLVDEYGISTNWRDEVFDGHAPTYNLDASISGGGSKMSYFVSLNHSDQQGIVEASGVRRESLRFNLDTNAKDWLKFGIQSNLSFAQYEQNAYFDNSGGIHPMNPASFARMAFPFDSPRYYKFDEQGNIQWGEKAEYLQYSQLPTQGYWNSIQDKQSKSVSANITLYEELKPVKGLTLRAQQALEAEDYTNSSRLFAREDLVSPMGGTFPGGDGSRAESFSRYYAFTYTNTAEYKTNFGQHYVNALLGQEAIITKNSGFGATSSGHTDNRQLLLQQGVKVAMSNLSQSISESVINSYFATLNYNYNSKYYLDLSFRRDGSSKFAPDHRWASFYSVGAMWNAKSEDFLKNISWLNDLSFKVSYGTTGNSSIGNYRYLGKVGSGQLYNGQSSLGIAGASNYDLTWETVGSFNFGLQTRLFDRLSIEADVYSKKTTDMLMYIPYSFTTGFSGGDGNVGSMTNKGIDVTASCDILKTKDFYWSVRANFNYNKNKIVELLGDRDELTMADSGMKYTVGHSASELYYVRRAGVDPRDGRQMWYDKDGNLTKVYNRERDAVLLGKEYHAPWIGGFGSQIMWKGLMVSADFNWAAKKYMMNNDRYFTENPRFAGESNLDRVMLNMWTEPGQVTDIPRVDEPIQFDDHLVENASFMRLKNLTVQYSLPQNLLSRTQFIHGLNVFFIGRNLWTVTNYRGYDPEPDANLVGFSYPNTKQFVFGLEVTF